MVTVIDGPKLVTISGQDGVWSFYRHGSDSMLKWLASCTESQARYGYMAEKCVGIDRYVSLYVYDKELAREIVKEEIDSALESGMHVDKDVFHELDFSSESSLRADLDRCSWAVDVWEWDFIALSPQFVRSCVGGIAKAREILGWDE